MDVVFMSVNFILQIVRIFHVGNYTDSELEMIYNFLITVDNDTLILYNNTNSVMSYINDLEIYIEVVDKMIGIYEERELYEKCVDLMNKKNESKIILKSKIEKNECV